MEEVEAQEVIVCEGAVDADALAKVEVPSPEASKQELKADVIVIGAGAADMGVAIACNQISPSLQAKRRV